MSYFWLMLAAVWPFIWHIGIGIAGLIVCGFLAYIVAPVQLKIVFVVLAAIVGSSIAGYIVGVKNEKAFCDALDKAVETRVDAAVSSSKSPHRLRDKYDQNWQH